MNRYGTCAILLTEQYVCAFLYYVVSTIQLPVPYRYFVGSNLYVMKNVILTS